MEAQQKFERLSKFLALDPQNIVLRRDCVDSALHAKRFDAALELADAGLAQAPLDDTLRFGKANALIGRGEFYAAVGILSELHALHPEQASITQNLALCFYVVNRFQEASDLLRRLYQDGERSVSVVRMLASSYHHLGLMDLAIEIADANKTLASEDAALAGVFSLIYLDDSRVADAARCATHSLRANPSCIDALTTQGTLKLAAGDTDAARRIFEEILNALPNNGRAWLGLGSIAMLQADYIEARRALSRAVETMPGHVGSWHTLGWMHLVQGELDEAEKAFNQAMDLNRNFAETHGALAAIAAMRGKLDQAQEMVKVAQRLDPNSLAAQFALSVIAARSGNASYAQEIIQVAWKKVVGSDTEVINRLINTSLLKTPRK